MLSTLIISAFIMVDLGTPVCRPQTADEFQARYSEARALEAAEISEEPNATTIVDERNARMIFLSRPEHDYHPSIVIRRVVQDGNSILVRSEGLSIGRSEACDKWLRAFIRQDSSIQKSFK